MVEPAAADEVRYLRWEAVTTVSWFLLDVSWLFELRLASLVFGAACVGAGLVTTLHSRRDVASLSVSLGVLAWVLMCAAWVTGDLHKIAWAVGLAKVLAGAVGVCLVTALVTSRHAHSAWDQVLERFRRLRL